MVIAPALEWMLSNSNIVTFVLLLAFIGGILYFLVRGK